MSIIKKIRALNRKRNYLKKELKYKVNLYKATKIWRHKPKENLSPSKVRTVLMIRNEGKIGDAIVSTCIFRAMHDAGIEIDVLAVRSNYMIFENNPYIRNLYLSNEMISKDIYDHAIPDDLMSVMKNHNYDLLIDTSIWDTGLYMPHMINALSPRISLGFNKPKWIPHYDVNITFNHYDSHTKEIYAAIIKYLGLTGVECQRYEVYHDESVSEDVKSIDFFNNKKKKVIINMYASHDDRNLTSEQTSEIVSGILLKNKDVEIIVIDYKKKFKCDFFSGAKVYHVPSLYHAMVAIQLCDLVISPDTAIVHISAMYDKPLIGIYRDIPDNNTLWSPGYSNGHQIFTSDYIVAKDSLIVNKVLNAIDEFHLI